MDVTEDKIKKIILQVVPDQGALDIVFYLGDKKNISEFIIAEELDQEIHRTRTLLYKLLDHNLVSFIRKKDKIKGWYICYWNFNKFNILHVEEKLRLQKIEKLQNRLTQEQNGFFYMCRFAHERQTFEDAFENDFKCPECGELMNQLNNERTIEFLNNKIAELEQEQQEYVQKKQSATKEQKQKQTSSA